MILLAALLLAAQGDPPPAPRNEQERLLLVSRSWESPPFAFGGYALPAEAATDAPLRRILLRRMERDRRAAARAALVNRAEHRRSGWYFNPHSLRFRWRTEGAAPGLLSLSATVTFFAGAGGYDAHRAAVLLWDRAAHRGVEMWRLLGSGRAGWQRRYCDLMRAAGEWAAPAIPVSLAPECPIALDDLVPADSDGNGRFDTLRLLRPRGEQNSERMTADELPFEPRDLRAIPRRYRAAFEVLPGPRAPRLGVEIEPD